MLLDSCVVTPQKTKDRVLKNPSQVESENHEMVSVFFADVVGYTDMCSTLPPDKVSLSKSLLSLEVMRRRIQVAVKLFHAVSKAVQL